MRFLIALLFVLVVGAVEAQVKSYKNLYPIVGVISREQVIWMYTMRTRFWPDGTKVTVFYRDPSLSVHQSFCYEVLRMTPSSFQQLVGLYVNNGNASYFREVASEEEMYNRVSSVEGSIGYLDSHTVVANKGNRHVQVLRIAD